MPRRALGLDPTELRRQNLIASFRIAAASAWRSIRRFRRQSRRRRASSPRLRGAARAGGAGRLRGLGVGCFLETSRGAPNEGAEVRFEPTAGVAGLGTQSNGQGHETSYPQIAADLLGLPTQAFRYVQADTRAVKSGAGMAARARCTWAARRCKAAQWSSQRRETGGPSFAGRAERRIVFRRPVHAVARQRARHRTPRSAAAARDPANLPAACPPVSRLRL